MFVEHALMTAMNLWDELNLPDIPTMEEMWERVSGWLVDPMMWWQAGALVLVVLATLVLAPRVRKRVRESGNTMMVAWRSNEQLFKVLSPLRLIFLGLGWFVLAGMLQAGIPAVLFQTVLTLVTAFVLLQIPPLFTRNRFWVRFFCWSIFVVVALHLLGIYEGAVTYLEGIRLELGDVRVTLLDLLRGLVALVFFLWLAGMAGSLVESRMRHARDVPPNLQGLVAKLIRFFLMGLALILALKAFGIDLTTLAIFGGALGLGIGFGLQKVVSNLFSGLVLLMDRSIKPGDVIEIGDTYGWINSLRMRYVSVITRDGKEHLIPNEDLITQMVVNWSFTDQLVRVRASVGVSYKTDVPKAIELCKQAAKGHPRVIKSKEVGCNLMGFGNSSVDLELRFWIRDPVGGVGNVRSEVYLEIWKLFRENGIEIPYPQRDLHLRSVDPEVADQIRGANSERRE